jgi:hypothetical protein
LIPIRSGFEDTMPALQRAVSAGSIGMAAGAEHVRLDDLGRVLESRHGDDDRAAGQGGDPFDQLSHVLGDGDL